MSTAADMDILLEEQADKQRVVEEQHLAELLRVARQQMLDAERAADEEAQAKRTEREQYHAGLLVKKLARCLGITIPIDRVRIADAGDFGEWYPAVEFAGLTFAFRVPSRKHHDDEAELVLARRCARGCGKEVWVEVSYRSELVEALDSQSHQHSFACLEPEKDYEIVEPKPSLLERWKSARQRRNDLEFRRPIERELATQRIRANGGITVAGTGTWSPATSASSAKELVHCDPEFEAFSKLVDEAVIEEQIAREQMILARPTRSDEEA